MLKAHFNTISKMPNYARKYSWSLTNVTCLQFVQKHITMNERVLKWFLHSNNFVEIRSFDDTHAPRQMALLFFHLYILNIWIKLQHWFTSEIFFSFFELLTSNSKDILEPHPNLQPQAVWSFFFIEHEIRSGCNSSEQCLFKKYQNET